MPLFNFEVLFMKKEHSHLDQELKIHSSNNKNYKNSQELSPQDLKLYKYIKKNSKRIKTDFNKDSEKDSKIDSKKIPKMTSIKRLFHLRYSLRYSTPTKCILNLF